jgi:defect-in-organelle-trafficking protein DotB
MTEELFSRGLGGGEVFDFKGRLSHDTFDQLLLWAVTNKVSDVTLQTGAPVWCDVGGKNRKGTKRSLDSHEIESVMKFIYGPNAAGMVISGDVIDPSYEVNLNDGSGRIVRFRVNMTGVRYGNVGGASITIRTLPGVPIELSKLGIEQEIIDNLRPAQGLNYITGPTGSGKSTLMASAIRHLFEGKDANEKGVEYSKPIEFVYDGLDFPSSHLSQVEVGRHIRRELDENDDSLWDKCVANALRRKPTIIIVGEAREKATIKSCIGASLTGHLVFSTIHTIGVPETIRRAISVFPGEERRGDRPHRVPEPRGDPVAGAPNWGRQSSTARIHAFRRPREKHPRIP